MRKAIAGIGHERFNTEHHRFTQGTHKNPVKELSLRIQWS
jgi:hypothetical protein